MPLSCGTFALVIGLLVWIYLGAQIPQYGTETNVVRKEHLWPRALVRTASTEAGDSNRTKPERRAT